MRTIAQFTMGLLVAVLLCATAQAQSNLVYFPYVVNDTQTSTELILTNLNNREANVILTGFKEDGSPVLSVTSIKVAASGQAAVGPSQFPAFRGWVLGSSDSAGVLGSVRVTSSDGSAQDVTEPALPDSVIVFPLVSESSGASTEISVVNPTGFFSRVNFTAYRSDGTVLAVSDKPLSPYGLYRGSLSNVFGSGISFAAASSIVARAVPQNIFSPLVNIVGFEVVRGFVRIPGDSSLQTIVGRRDWAALPAVPVAAGSSSMVFPHAFRLPDWFALIGLVNLSNSSQTVTVSYSATGTSKSLSIPANGSIQATTLELFGPGADSGSLKVTSAGSIAGYLAIGFGPSFAVSSGQASGLSEFFFPTVDEAPGAFTGIVLQNDSAVAAVADLYLISPEGSTLGHQSELVPPNNRIVKLVRDYFIEGLNQTGGYVFVRSTGPTFSTAALGVADRTLSEFSGSKAPSAFTPPPQSLFAIRGKITDISTEAAASGASVVLSSLGAPNSTVAAGANGEFIFKALGAADYTVAPLQAGRMFSPPNRSLRVDTASQVVTFQRELAPIVTAITVTTTDIGTQRTAGNNPDAFAIFGTSQVSLKLTGSNFASGQKAFFGSTELPLSSVSVVDSQTMFVNLALSSPEILLELTGRGIYAGYNITVAGQPPFGASRSNALPFYVLPALPVVLAVTAASSGTDETFARYEINSPGESLTVTGFGFRPGARVLFDESGVLGGVEIDTKFVSSTLLQVTLPPQALRFGGIYTVRVRNTGALPEVSAENVRFTVFNLSPVVTPLGTMAVFGPGPTVPISFPITGTNFYPAGKADPGTQIFVTTPPVCTVGNPPVSVPEATTLSSSTFVSSSQIVLNNIAVPCLGTYTITVSNSSPGGGSSVTSLVITAGPASAVPVIRGVDPLSPASVSAGGSSFNLTVFRDLSGAPFQNDAWVNFGTVRLNRIPGDTDTESITVSVPSLLVTSPGIVPITVTNPGTGGTTGGTSLRVFFAVN